MELCLIVGEYNNMETWLKNKAVGKKIERENEQKHDSHVM